jgi:hypothetical protein
VLLCGDDADGEDVPGCAAATPQDVLLVTIE